MNFDVIIPYVKVVAIKIKYTIKVNLFIINIAISIIELVLNNIITYFILVIHLNLKYLSIFLTIYFQTNNLLVQC